jgi:WASH complex subunit 7
MTATAETTTLWEFLFPESKKETSKATQTIRQDLSSFLHSYATGLEDLYQAIDQNPCQIWGVASTPVGLQYPFPTERSIDEFFQDFENEKGAEIIYPIKMLTGFITFIDNSVKRAETEFYPQIALFGETVEVLPLAHESLATDSGIPKGDLEALMSEALPWVIAFSNFLPDVLAVGHRFVEYLFYLYSDQNPLFHDHFQATVYTSCFSAIGRLLKMIYTFSVLINDHPVLRDSWENLRKMLFAFSKDPSQYSVSEEDVTFLQQSFVQIHRVTFPEDLLVHFLGTLSDFAQQPCAKNFVSQLERYLDDEVDQFLKLMKTGEHSDLEPLICDLSLLVQFLILYKPSPKKKIIQNLWNSYPIVPIVKLFNTCCFSAAEYLMQVAPTQVLSAVGQNTASQLKSKLVQGLQTHDQSLGALVVHIFSMFSRWQSVCQTQLIAGLNTAYFLRSVITKTIDLHSALGKPLNAQSAEHLGRLIEILKAVQLTFFLNQSAITHNLPAQTDFHIQKIRGMMHHVADQMRKRSYRVHRDALSALMTLVTHCMAGFTSCYAGPCLEIIADMYSCKAFSGLGFTRADTFATFRTLRFLQNYNYHIDRACNVGFMIDERGTFTHFIRTIINEPRRILFLAQAMNDVADMVKDKPDLYAKFDEQFSKLVRDEFITKIFDQIEVELRFHSHQHLQVSERNPLKTSFASFDKFLSIPPFKLVSRFVDIRFEANYHFSRTFYNEIAVSPQVWETYAEMGNIASRLYGIDILDCHIPGAMMQQDIDVLEIMRHISAFVACYNYDLNSQVFVQRSNESHHVSIVGIPHIFASYRCHGIGIMNTTVDFTYRFLKLKFNVFSKFLFDDSVKSQLVNDIAWFDVHKEEVDGQWPYARAEKLVESMKRLGQSAEGNSPLDQFRGLITEIGNALGFVRMVKSGGARFLNNAIGFVYDEDQELSFRQFCDEVQLEPPTMEATSRLDSVVGKLKTLFNGGDSFFKLLVDVFTGAFRDKRNSHLHNFYAIVPALTLSYLQHISQLKDEVQKQNKNASFSDDGFPMGLAYVLKLLDQDALFDSIHWFASLKAKAQQDRAEAQNTSKKNPAWSFAKGGNKQTVKLTLAMIAKGIREYELLDTTVHSARILFN